MGNSVLEDKYLECNSSERPDFFPCSDCGRYFTLLAMTVHKRTCLESEHCECSVCKSDFKKVKYEKHKNNGASLRNNLYRWQLSKTKAGMKPNFQHVLTGKIHSKENPEGKTNLIFNCPDESNNIFRTMLKDNESADASILQEIDKTTLHDHEYISLKAESSEKNDISSDNSNDSVTTSLSFKSKLKVDHDCDRKLFCRYCDSHVFWESFGLHIIQHCERVEEKFLKCPECDRKFTQPVLYLTHYLIHNSEHSVFCIDCSCSYPLCIFTQRATEPNFAENYPHHCYICLSHFSHPQTVINHMRLHSKEMPFKCTVCNRTFRQVGNLQRHMTTHRGDRPYKCPNCPSSFADPATLRNHERVHTGETPYVCPICNRGFSQVGNLKRHMPLHLQNIASSPSTIEINSEQITSSVTKPSNGIKCSNISTEYLQSSQKPYNQSELDCVVKNDEICNLKSVNSINHKNSRKKGKIKVFTCEICKKVYTWQHDLVVHFRTHTGEKPYECEICGKRFAQSGAIRTHKERHHSDSGILKKHSS